VLVMALATSAYGQIFGLGNNFGLGQGRFIIAPAPVPVPLPAPVEPAPADAYPRYDYSYAVNAPETGDFKKHEETRDGDNVQGQYSLVEPDGSLRTVTYTAGKDGFVANVEKQEGFAAPAPVAPRVVVQPAPVLRVAQPAIRPIPVAVAQPAPRFQLIQQQPRVQVLRRPQFAPAQVFAQPQFAPAQVFAQPQFFNQGQFGGIQFV